MIFDDTSTLKREGGGTGAVTGWKESLRSRARIAGFLDARVAPAAVPEAAAAAYRSWVAAGYHGEMSYMDRLVDERATGVEHILPGAKSVIVLAASYWFDGGPGDAGTASEAEQARASTQDSREGDDGLGTTGPRDYVRVARYALGRDYHYVLKDRMAPLIEWLEGEFPGEQFRPCVDSAPLLERTYAAASGIGFIGKNAMVITWMQGSFTFLCEIVTTAEIEPDTARHGTCGNCTRCLDACPTQAFTGPGQLDSRKCISYLTIEKKSELTAAEADATGQWVFGCDICQDVCPYNKSPEESAVPDFAPATVVKTSEPAETFLEPESNRQFERRFAASPILRAGKRRLQALVRRKKQGLK